MCPDRDTRIASLAIGEPRPVQTSLAVPVEDAHSLSPPAVTTAFHEPDDEGPLYAARKKIYPQRVTGTYRRVKWACCSSRSASTTCCRSCAGIADRTRRSQAVLIDFPEPALLFLLHRDLAAGNLLRHRPADPRRDGAVPDERGRRTGVVRLSVSADGVDRPVPGHRALDRRRPARASAARPRSPGRPNAWRGRD